AMSERGLLVKTEERMTPVGRSYRSKAIIEYRLCDQWFVKMKPLAEKALAASDAGRVTFHPERWDGIYRTWLANIRDWCISRQIWWGHRIPAWYHVDTGEILVDVETPAAVTANPDRWRQDDDVLDTWFSSALWPLSTLGWPHRTKDLERYYPTSLLSTAKDIIFFWVARMVMTGMEFENEVPFEDVYIHSVICDEDGMVMSKSKGNGIDPTHVIRGASLEDLEGPAREARPSNMDELLRRVETNFPKGFEGVGADALRYTLLSATSDLQQIRLSLTRFTEVGKPFLTKLWNATKFALQRSLEAIVPASVTPSEAALEDRWILSRLDDTTARVRKAYDAFHFQEACEALRAFFWNDLCDWYLELVKPRLDGDDAERRRVQLTLCEALAGFLRLLHPVMPFITEELWGHLHPRLVEGQLVPEKEPDLAEREVLAEAHFPIDHGRYDQALESEFALLREVVRVIREARATAGLLPKVPLEVRVRPLSEAHRGILAVGSEILVRSANLASFAACDETPAGMTLSVVEGAEVYVNLAEHLDVGAETERLAKEEKKTASFVGSLEAKLANENYVSRAPEQVVAADRQRLAEARAKLDKIQKALEDLKTSN
ncbi:MAG: class I tRNA ligase family protein, partial [Planctomycetes bacterium]|nr:class I tRNA ligase family protein [Planctomycetota bacterium]